MHGWENLSPDPLKNTDDIPYEHSRLSQKLLQATSPLLPGQDAQYRAVPPDRPRTDPAEAASREDTRKAGVMALLHPIGEVTHVALIRRNEYPGVHSGQISFPGGKSEPDDTDLLHTAQRETEEEVGVSPGDYRIWVPLTEVYIPPSRFLVQPYVGIAGHELSFTREEREVVEVFHVPLHRFLDREALHIRKISVGNFKMDIPAYDFEGHIIWGATAMMLSELATLVEHTLE